MVLLFNNVIASVIYLLRNNTQSSLLWKLSWYQSPNSVGNYSHQTSASQTYLSLLRLWNLQTSEERLRPPSQVFRRPATSGRPRLCLFRSDLHFPTSGESNPASGDPHQAFVCLRQPSSDVVRTPAAFIWHTQYSLTSETPLQLSDLNPSLLTQFRQHPSTFRWNPVTFRRRQTTLVTRRTTLHSGDPQTCSDEPWNTPVTLDSTLDTTPDFRSTAPSVFFDTHKHRLVLQFFR